MKRSTFLTSTFVVLMLCCMFIHAQSQGDNHLAFSYAKMGNEIATKQGDYRYYFTDNQFSIIKVGNPSGEIVKDVFRFENTNEARHFVPQDNQSNKGQQATKWTELWYKNLYKNIDVRVYSDEFGNPLLDFIIHPGADIQAVSLQHEGTSEIVSNKQAGKLSLKNPHHQKGIRATTPLQINGAGKIALGIPDNYDKKETLVITATIAQ